MIVISDASPLISLAVVGRLELLQRLYGDVLIPDAVQREIATASPGAPGAAEVETAAWIRVADPRDTKLVDELSAELDLGEAAAIALAIEMHADLLIMDERRGRAVAARFGRYVIGVLGVLVESKRHGLLPAVRPTLDALITHAGFRVSEELRSRVLDATGESA